MSIENVLMVLLFIVILFAVAFLAKWIIDTFFPEPIKTPALLVVGVILLIVVVFALPRFLPAGGVLHR